MSRKMIPAKESFAVWHEDPEYEKAYNALQDELALAAAMTTRALAPVSRSISWASACPRRRRSSHA
jgi:hypothetical protein